jgi:hypothetical protein
MTLATLLAAAPSALAKPAWTSGTYVYADLCTESDGARAGHRITLRRSPNGDGLTYEGARLPGAARAGTIAVDDATRTIAFDVETPSGPLAFRGTLGSDALTGALDDEAGSRLLSLPRVLRSRAHEACRVETTGSIGR